LKVSSIHEFLNQTILNLEADPTLTKTITFFNF